MLISQAIQDLQVITKKKITYNDIAEALGLSKQAIGSRASRNSELKQYEWEKIQEYFYNKTERYKKENNISTNNVMIDYYPDMQISAGNNNIELIGKIQKISVPKELISSYSDNKKYFILKASGDSMLPSIKDGDKLIIEHQKSLKITDNKVYVFFYNDKLLCKRLILHIDKLVVMSDNNDKTTYPTQYIIEKEINNVHILGRLVGSIRRWE